VIWHILLYLAIALFVCAVFVLFSPLRLRVRGHWQFRQGSGYSASVVFFHRFLFLLTAGEGGVGARVGWFRFGAAAKRGRKSSGQRRRRKRRWWKPRLPFGKNKRSDGAEDPTPQPEEKKESTDAMQLTPDSGAPAEQLPPASEQPPLAQKDSDQIHQPSETEKLTASADSAEGAPSRRSAPLQSPEHLESSTSDSPQKQQQAKQADAENIPREKEAEMAPDAENKAAYAHTTQQQQKQGRQDTSHKNRDGFSPSKLTRWLRGIVGKIKGRIKKLLRLKEKMYKRYEALQSGRAGYFWKHKKLGVKLLRHLLKTLKKFLGLIRFNILGLRVVSPDFGLPHQAAVASGYVHALRGVLYSNRVPCNIDYAPDFQGNILQVKGEVDIQTSIVRLVYPLVYLVVFLPWLHIARVAIGYWWYFGRKKAKARRRETDAAT